jgi:hypothetical protein
LAIPIWSWLNQDLWQVLGELSDWESNNASAWTEGKDGAAIQGIKEHQPEGHLGQVKASAGGPRKPVVYQS